MVWFDVNTNKPYPRWHGLFKYEYGLCRHHKTNLCSGKVRIKFLLLYDHVVLTNLQITNNFFVEQGFLMLGYTDFLQNVLVEDCTVVANVNLEHALFSIAAAGTEDWMIESQYQWFEIDDKYYVSEAGRKC